MMSDPRPRELIHAEELINMGKINEALEIIETFENRRDLSPSEQLWILLLRGWISFVRVQINDVVNFGDEAYLLSLKLGLLPERIEALCLKANIGHLGEPDKFEPFIREAEELLTKLTDSPSFDLSMLKLKLLFIKNFGLTHNEDYDTALEIGLNGLDLAKKIDSKLFVALFLYAISRIHSFKLENDLALDYIMKSIELTDELGLKERKAWNLYVAALIYSNKRDINTAIDFCERSLKIPEISKITRISVLTLWGNIYNMKGELDLARDKFEEVLQLSEEISYIFNVVNCLSGLGEIYRKRNDYEQASLYFNRSLILSHKFGFHEYYNYIIFNLFLINLDNNQVNQAHNYLEELRQSKSQGISSFYSLAKAIMLKTKKRARDRAEAEKILKNLGDTENLGFYIPMLSLITLGDFLLEELSESNDPEIIEEITPLIQQLLEEAENQKAISFLAEGTLLQAKLALITLDFNKANSLLSQAQKLAEDYGLILLARKISSEYDILLERTEEWKKLQRQDATLSERIKLASFDGVLNRLQGKQAIDPPEIINEEPILLLIMDNSGATYFNHPFVENWDYSDLFSSFMSAFNTFMDEIFSKSIDRIRVGENTILINPVEQFLACYVIKGQSYPALQKLSRFTEAIRENLEIWQALEKSVKTSEMLELDKPPALKTVINEIFT